MITIYVNQSGERGLRPLSKTSSPFPLKERGIKGVRLANKLNIRRKK